MNLESLISTCREQSTKWLLSCYHNPGEQQSALSREAVETVLAERGAFQGREDDGSTGFRAFADDFPPGTTLVVTARVEIPDDDVLNECPLCGRTDTHTHQIP